MEEQDNQEPTISDILKEQEEKGKKLNELFEIGEKKFEAIARIMADSLLETANGSSVLDYAEAFLPKLKKFMADSSREDLEDLIVSHCLGSLEEGIKNLKIMKSMGILPPNA